MGPEARDQQMQLERSKLAAELRFKRAELRLKQAELRAREQELNRAAENERPARRLQAGFIAVMPLLIALIPPSAALAAYTWSQIHATRVEQEKLFNAQRLETYKKTLAVVGRLTGSDPLGEQYLKESEAYIQLQNTDLLLVSSRDVLLSTLDFSKSLKAELEWSLAAKRAIRSALPAPDRPIDSSVFSSAQRLAVSIRKDLFSEHRIDPEAIFLYDLDNVAPELSKAFEDESE